MWHCLISISQYVVWADATVHAFHSHCHIVDQVDLVQYFTSQINIVTNGDCQAGNEQFNQNYIYKLQSFCELYSSR